MSNRRLTHIDISRLRLANDEHVLDVTVSFNDGGINCFTNERCGKGIYLGISPVIAGNGSTSFMMFSGPKGFKTCLEKLERYNEKRLVAIAEEVKALGGDSSMFGEAYEGLLAAVLTENGYELATSDDEAYKPETFVVGQRVEFGSGEKKDLALVVGVTDEGKFSGKPEYDLLLDANWLYSNRTAEDHGEKRIFAIEGEPILDADEIQWRMDEYKQAVADRETEKTEKANAEQAAQDEQLAGLKKLYPWAKQDGSNHARASANLKTELSRAFPSVVFSVKSDSYSMGDSVYVKWTDGPTETQVREISRKYQYTYMSEQDMYTDGQSYKSDAFSKAVKIWLGSSKYVSESREISEELTQKLAADLLPHKSLSSPTFRDDDPDARQWARQVLYQTDATGEYTGVALDGHVWMPQFDIKPVSAFASVSATVGASVSAGGVTITENEAKAGIELRFAEKPDEDVRSTLKRNGFRWSGAQRLWYAKANERTRAFANGLAGESPSPDHFDMRVEDSMAEACGLTGGSAWQ